VSVQVHQGARHRPYLVEDLPVMLLPGGEAHQQQAASLGVGEPRHVLDQFLGLGGIVQLVDAILGIQPAALGQTEQFRGLSITQRRPGTVNVAYRHRPSILPNRPAWWPASWRERLPRRRTWALRLTGVAA
jgi:hypothetical protein